MRMIVIMSADYRSLFDPPDATDRHLQPGEALFHAGDATSHTALVRSGLMQLMRWTSAGSTVILQTARSGDVLAEASAYSQVHHCGAVAAQVSLVSLVPIPAFRRRLRADPDIAETWSEHLAKSVQAARMLAELRTLHTVAERVDAWLGQGGKLPAKGAWQDLAAELGVTREALYRELARRR